MNDFTQTRQLALASLSKGRPDQAVGYCQRLTQLRPQDPDGYFLLGMAEDARNQIAAAIAAVEKAISYKETAEYLAHYARILSRLKRMDRAAAAAQKAIDLEPKDALTLDTIGCVYSRIGQHAKAIPIFEQAIALKSDNPQFRFNLATSLQFVGELDKAEKEHEHIIQLAPGFVKAHTALSSLRKQTKENNHIARLDSILGRVRNPKSSLHLRYALAKECEDIGLDNDAFEHLNTANTQHKKMLGYSIDTDRILFQALKSAFPEKIEQQAAEEFASDDPIFIVGMPRSGTTLVDRIISSHPDVESAGELQVLPLLLKRMSGTDSRVVLDPETIAAAKEINFSELGKQYITESLPHRTSDRRFTDKLPLNFFNVGYVAQALPNAKIVCLRRNPMDTVWSNFKHLFATDFSYYNYSYDLRDTAEYIAMFNDLVDHWDKVMPSRVYNLHYENLVSDFEPQVRKLIEHLELDWSDHCLRFYENEEAVATPSAAQVRNPIYAGSVGKWKRFEKHLSDAIETFKSRGVNFE